MEESHSRTIRLPAKRELVGSLNTKIGGFLFDLKGLTLRLPTLTDGMDVHRLIESSPPLDTNSSYCNLLQCSHFASTSVAAVADGALVGFISGYLIPDRPDTLFIWQVAVAEQARGQRLAAKMLDHILSRTYCKNIRYIETSITEDNQASLAVFKSLANTLDADISVTPWMDKALHFSDLHDSEPLVRVGPFTHSAIQEQ